MAHTLISRDHIPPAQIRLAGRQDIERYGTMKFVDRPAVRAKKHRGGDASKFEVEDQDGQIWRGKKVVLAMGVKDLLPTGIEGYADCWSCDIYRCLFCDGIERSHLPAGQLEFDSTTGLHMIDMMVQLGCPEITIFGNGPLRMDDTTLDMLDVAISKGVKIDEREIRRLIHLDNDQGIEMVFEDGGTTRVGFLAHRPASNVVGLHIARGLAVHTTLDGMGGTLLKRNEPFGESNVTGVFVAGDAGSFMRQVTIAMQQGVQAGAAIHQQICSDERW